MDCDRDNYAQRGATRLRSDLGSGLIITAAHLTAVEAKMSVHIAGRALPATVLKQGSAEDIDLSILVVDEQKLPAGYLGCNGVKRLLGQEILVTIVDGEHATQSHIISPQVLPFTQRIKFHTLTSGRRGSGSAAGGRQAGGGRPGGGVGSQGGGVRGV